MGEMKGRTRVAGAQGAAAGAKRQANKGGAYLASVSDRRDCNALVEATELRK